MKRKWIGAGAMLWALVSIATAQTPDRRTQNVILITLDGARTQEIFGGLDLEIARAGAKKVPVDQTPLYRKYWAPTAEERREKLLPFFWGTLMKHHGSIAGNRSLGSVARVTNGHRFSYPGYSEILTGQAHDEVIDSNDKKQNPYPSVLEFLQRKLQLGPTGVAAFASWDTMNWIVEHRRGSFTTNAGFQEYLHPDPLTAQLSGLQFETSTPWESVRHDTYTFRFALAHLGTYQPRVLYLSLGETDDWAHDGRYDKVLEALQRTDSYLRQLWEFLQKEEAYRDKTTILITVDHGRGNSPTDWTDHGKKVQEAQYIWLAAISPDSALRGEWKNAETVYQNQVAATLCRFLGLDYSEQNPTAGKPIARLF